MNRLLMNKPKLYPMAMALLAAILFGGSAPLTKMLLGRIDPIPLAAFLYIGSGSGLLIFQLAWKVFKNESLHEAPLKLKDIPWLVGAILFGGVLAPISLLISLESTPASTASLLLNFEGAATTLIAIFFFKENAGRKVIGAVALITLASIILSWDFSNKWGFPIAGIGIIFACICWGIDNNFTRNISGKNPFSIVIIKGITAGSFSLILALILKNNIPGIKVILIAMLIGFICYGSSIVLFVLAMRSLGSARTSALFGVAPFVGAILSFMLLGDKISETFLIAFPIMIIGAVLLLKENHNHIHRHEPMEHEHKHNHSDGHHNHIHAGMDTVTNGPHTHVHSHEPLEHNHPHSPDTDHRHKHQN